MPSFAYYEDADFGVDLDEDSIAKCADVETLIGWSDDAEATIEDIKLQIQGAALGNTAAPIWVYRASKAMGFMGRARSRIQARLLVLGWTKPKTTRDLAEAAQKLAEAKAQNAVAVEFLRLCAEGGFTNREQFNGLEKQAIAGIALREKKRAENDAARAAIKEIAA
jgi:hypothetical protein